MKSVVNVFALIGFLSLQFVGWGQLSIGEELSYTFPSSESINGVQFGIRAMLHYRLAKPSFMDHFRASYEYSGYFGRPKVLQPNGSVLYAHTSGYQSNIHYIFNPRDSTMFYLLAGANSISTKYDYGDKSQVSVSFSSEGYNLGFGFQTKIGKVFYLLGELKFLSHNLYPQAGSISNVVSSLSPNPNDVVLSIGVTASLGGR
jgi:hypothetical protein